MPVRRDTIYPGIHNDRFAGMTDIGRIIRDAWALGVLPEDETCEGWSYGRIQEVYDQVYKAWQPYGHLVSKLPPDMQERYLRIHHEATRKARELGWVPPMEDS